MFNELKILWQSSIEYVSIAAYTPLPTLPYSILLNTSIKLSYFIMGAIVPYNRLLQACLLHARLLQDCTNALQLISLLEHENERYADRLDV